MSKTLPLFSHPTHAGAFELTAWDVWEFFTEREFLDVVNMTCEPVPGTLGFRRKSHPISLPNNVMERNVAILRTREHEWTHFRQHISTQLGVFYHRLCGVREVATLEYFKELNKEGMGYQCVPFSSLYLSSVARGSSSPHSLRQTDLWLRAWYYAEVIDGALWCKKVQMRDLINIWHLIRDVLQNLRFFEADGEGCLLHTKRDLDEFSCPDGHITVQQLTEGFAKSREFVEICGMYSFDDAVKYIVPTTKGIYVASSEYVREHLGIPFFHPLSIALHEASLNCFVDPFFQESGQILYWEDIHPGLRFEQAVKKLKSSIAALPVSWDNAYAEARSAFGFDDMCGLSNRQLDGFTHDYQPIESLRLNGDYSEGALGKLYRQYHKSTFIDALRLRNTCPMIFFEPHLAPPDALSKFMSITRPPVIVGPKKLFLPFGEGRDLSIGVASIYHAVLAHLIDEITRDAKLTLTKEFVKRGRRTSRRFFDKQSIRTIIRRSFGSCIDPHLDYLTGDIL